MMRVARCCCQACSVEVEGEPTLNAVCHCDSCKRRTGSAFGWSAYFRDEDIKARHGELATYTFKGPPEGRRWFCPTCGSTVMWEGGDGQTGFAGGCFASTPLPEPNISARDAQRCAWVSLPEHWMKVSPP
jgi:hypothetical protein